MREGVCFSPCYTIGLFGLVCFYLHRQVGQWHWHLPGRGIRMRAVSSTGGASSVLPGSLLMAEDLLAFRTLAPWWLCVWYRTCPAVWRLLPISLDYQHGIVMVAWVT